MKKGFLTLIFLGLFFSVPHSQTLFDGWIFFSSSYLGDNVYEYNYKWGANTTLSQEEIDNLFPYETGPYMGDGLYRREITGIGTQDFGFFLDWVNPVDILWMSSYYEFNSDMLNKTIIDSGDLFGPWSTRFNWNRKREFTFRTKGNTGMQNIGVNIDYYGLYSLISGRDRGILCLIAETPLRVTGSFGHSPEPTTLLLLGSGLLGWAGFTRLKPRKKR